MNGAANACRWRKLPFIESFELPMAYDYNRPFIERKDLAKYLAVDRDRCPSVRLHHPGNRAIQRRVQDTPP